MGKHVKKVPKRRPGIFISCVVVLAVGFILLTSGVAAKYVQQWGLEGVLAAREFFFCSDLLKAEGNHYDLNANVEMLEFEIFNYDGSSVSEMNISYTIRVDNGALVNGHDSISGTMKANSAETLSVILSNLEGGKTYTVTAEGNGGYRQNLSATFTVGLEDEAVYKNTKTEDEYILLTVWTKGAGGNVVINIPEGLIPDGTDPYLKAAEKNYSEAGYAAIIGIDGGVLDEYSSRSYRFFRAGYSTGDITVTVAGKTATETSLE